MRMSESRSELVWGEMEATKFGECAAQFFAAASTWGGVLEQEPAAFGRRLAASLPAPTAAALAARAATLKTWEEVAWIRHSAEERETFAPLFLLGCLAAPLSLARACGAEVGGRAPGFAATPTQWTLPAALADVIQLYNAARQKGLSHSKAQLLVREKMAFSLRGVGSTTRWLGDAKGLKSRVAKKAGDEPERKRVRFSREDCEGAVEPPIANIESSDGLPIRRAYAWDRHGFRQPQESPEEAQRAAMALREAPSVPGDPAAAAVGRAECLRLMKEDFKRRWGGAVRWSIGKKCEQQCARGADGVAVCGCAGLAEAAVARKVWA